MPDTDGITNVEHRPTGETPPPAAKRPPKALIAIIAFTAVAIVAFVLAIALLKPPGG